MTLSEILEHLMDTVSCADAHQRSLILNEYLARTEEADPIELRNALEFLKKSAGEMPADLNTSNMIELLEEQLGI